MASKQQYSCYFCTCTIATHHVNDKTPEIPKSVSIHPIVKTNLADDEPVTQDFEICEKCFKLQHSLTNLLEKLDCLNRHINGQMQKLFEMQCASGLRNHIIQFRKELNATNSKELLLLKDMQKVRSQFITQWELALNTSWSKTQLQVLPKEELKTMELENSTECDVAMFLPGVMSYIVVLLLALPQSENILQNLQQSSSLESIPMQCSTPRKYAYASVGSVTETRIQMKTFVNCGNCQLRFQSQAQLNFHNRRVHCQGDIIISPQKLSSVKAGSTANSKNHSKCKKESKIIKHAKLKKTPELVNKNDGKRQISKHLCYFEGCGKHFQTSVELKHHKMLHGKIPIDFRYKERKEKLDLKGFPKAGKAGKKHDGNQGNKVLKMHSSSHIGNTNVIKKNAQTVFRKVCL